MKKLTYSILLLVAFLFLSSCGNKKSNIFPVDSDAKVDLEILKNWGENIIVPTYKNYQSKVGIMVNDAKSFKENRTQENFENLKKSWLNAYKAFQKTLIFNFDFAEKTYLIEMANTYPANVASINKNIALIEQNKTNEIPLEPTYADVQRTYQGFPALDYLLFEQGHTLAYFNGTKGDGVCTYIVLLSEVLKKNSDYVVSRWGEYINTYIKDTDASSNGAYAKTINSFIKAYEKNIRAEKVGYAGGFIPSQKGNASPEIIEAYYNENVSKELLKIALKSSQDFFNGVHFNNNTKGKSLYSALIDKNKKSLADKINNQYTEIYKAIENTPKSLKETAKGALTNAEDKKNFEELYIAMQKNVAHYKTEMLAVLRVVVGYVDTDGD